MYQLKSQTNMPSKDKESTCSPQDVASSWFSTELDYTAVIDYKPTKDSLNWWLMHNKDIYGKGVKKYNKKCKQSYKKGKFPSKLFWIR